MSLAAGTTAGAVVAGAYLGLVTAAAPLDLNVGRRTRPLGPRTVDVHAPREVVFDLLAEPYLGRTARAIREKVPMLERGSRHPPRVHRRVGYRPGGGRRMVGFGGRHRWEQAVADTFHAVRTEAERRAGRR